MLNLKSSDRAASVFCRRADFPALRSGEISTNIIRHIYRRTNGKYILIGLGGVFTAEDAYEKIKAGASLVQIITRLIYEVPRS